MKNELAAKLDTIFHYPFFESVGKPLPPGLTAVSDWSAAAEECTTAKWENCRLAARNAMQGFLEERNWERMQIWEPLSDELRPKIVSFVDHEIIKTPIPHHIFEKVKHDLSWDFMFICLEHEFRDVIEPLFHLRYLDPWYAQGHFPCGWDGVKFPAEWDGTVRNGQLMVF